MHAGDLPLIPVMVAAALVADIHLYMCQDKLRDVDVGQARSLA